MKHFIKQRTKVICFDSRSKINADDSIPSSHRETEPMTLYNNEDIAFGSIEMYLHNSKEINKRIHRFFKY